MTPEEGAMYKKGMREQRQMAAATSRARPAQGRLRQDDAGRTSRLQHGHGIAEVIPIL